MPNAEPSRAGEAPGGSGQVETALSRLAELDSVSFDGAVQVYDDIHRSLSAALDGDCPLRPVPEQ